MLPRRVHLGPLVQPGVDGVQPRGQVAAHVEPPVTDEHGLRKLRPVWAEERRLAAVNVAVVPTWKKERWRLAGLEMSASGPKRWRAYLDSAFPCRRRSPGSPARRSKSWCTGRRTGWGSRFRDVLKG